MATGSAPVSCPWVLFAQLVTTALSFCLWPLPRPDHHATQFPLGCALFLAFSVSTACGNWAKRNEVCSLGSHFEVACGNVDEKYVTKCLQSITDELVNTCRCKLSLPSCPCRKGRLILA